MTTEIDESRGSSDCWAMVGFSLLLMCWDLTW
jgi:hypothetical protein